MFHSRTKSQVSARSLVIAAVTGVMTLGSLALPSAPAHAASVGLNLDLARPGIVTQVDHDDWRWRRHRSFDGYYNGKRDYDSPRRIYRDRDRDRDRRYWRRHRDRDDLAAGLGGLAAGALLGGVLAQGGFGGGGGNVVSAPPAAGYAPFSAGYMSYCSSRYRSFDPRTGTFMGYDGQRHFCR
ncbi:BA14K family protein [Chthonobacter albigriseus]|uniref:BA14K family protein n=1 Tax=Chthonobacter albigriseus TaxID=1683161 RepID=UPI001FCE745D|nr:BA14K family protein [Chthonobacter albigriseus]